MAAVEIRAARDDDRRPMAELLARVAEERDGIGTEPPVDIDARAARFETEGAFVAMHGDEMVGQISVQPTRHGYAELGMLVAREWRGRGVGSQLMSAAIGWARARGDIHKLSLGVWTHNAAAIALYEKFGFVEEGRRLKHYRRQSGELWDTIDMGLLL